MSRREKPQIADRIEQLEAELTDVLGKLPDATLWMTRESRWRLSNGGNNKGAVPVHGKQSATAKIPLYTEEQMQAERERCFDIGRNVGFPNVKVTGLAPGKDDK